jgi:hypothetical protein
MPEADETLTILLQTESNQAAKRTFLFFVLFILVACVCVCVCVCVPLVEVSALD